ncbi:ATP-binding protein [Candidatus Micrarchaeota archaeon]|nr:ATP-binding protein [Candidatus Micrarchaeota archaeon]
MEKTMLLQNPWWENPDRLNKDERVAEALSKVPPTLTVIDETLPYKIILGPRQVGKTTKLKLSIRDLIYQKSIDPRSILYFSCEPLSGKKELIDLLVTFDQFTPNKKYLFLDELTSVKDWEQALKFFLDSPLKENKILVATGSNALFLKHGTERMPGRNLSIEFDLPFTFREYLMQFGSASLRKTLGQAKLVFDSISSSTIENTSKKLLPFLNEINSAFLVYTKTGGFLKSIYEYHETKKIQPSTYEIYVRWILGDLNSLGKNEQTFLGVMKGIVKNYSSASSYLSIAKETNIPSHTTVNDYLCMANDLLLTNTLNAVDLSKQSAVLRKEKKHYFTDPFLYSAFSGYVQGVYKDYSEDSLEHLVEGIVCEALSRLGRRDVDHSHFLWYFRKRKETDFALKTDQGTVGIEVKWVEKAHISEFENFFSFKERVLLTKNNYQFIGEKNFIMLPLPLFLAIV